MNLDAGELVRKYLDAVWNQGDMAGLDALTTENFTYRLGGQPPLDRAAMRSFLGMMRAAFPDWHVSIADIVAAGDAVAVRWEGEATHAGPFRGIPPTGRRITVNGINIYRLREGRIETEWEQTDSLGMLRQMGVLPPA